MTIRERLSRSWQPVRRRYSALNPTARRMTLMLLVVGLVLFLIFGFEAFRTVMINRFMATLSNPPQTVSTVAAATSDWQQQLAAVGSLRAVNGADLSLEVSGIVASLNFNSGDDVTVGQVLMQLRDDDDVAHLQSLQASEALSQITYDRDQKQVKINAIAQSQFDTDAANLKNAQAQVAEQAAVVAKKILTAPFAGHIGIRQVDLGQYLNAGTVIVTLQAVDPVFVDFYLPQQALDRIAIGQDVTASVDTYPGVAFTGKIAVINPKVDANSRNVAIRAQLANPDHKLVPGMYATVAIAVGATQPYVTLPQTAVTYNPYGSTVFLVVQDKDASGKEQLTAHQSFVTTGQTRGDQVAITSGVKAGDTVVSAGQLKLRNGSRLIVNNSVQPANDANPTPADQ
jgi:membrane fusion protein (multidrug efflux system)